MEARAASGPFTTFYDQLEVFHLHLKHTLQSFAFC